MDLVDEGRASTLLGRCGDHGRSSVGEAINQICRGSRTAFDTVSIHTGVGWGELLLVQLVLVLLALRMLMLQGPWLKDAEVSFGATQIAFLSGCVWFANHSRTSTDYSRLVKPLSARKEERRHLAHRVDFQVFGCAKATIICR